VDVDAAIKYFFAQGPLGVVCVILLLALRKLWMENKSLTDRLESKADKHAELNRETARDITKAFETAIRSAEQAKQKRRPTVSRPAVDDHDDK
jgi:predicted Holliday junction resolvase-like endonuclease